MSKTGEKKGGAKLIGLTGSIGAGKSTVAKLFESLGIPVYDSDSAAKRLMQANESLISKIKKQFGSDIYDDSNQLNRQALAQIVFNNPHKLLQLNRLVHPTVAEDFRNWTQIHSNQPYIIKEAAILFESKANKGLDKIICVTAPADIRRQRVMTRDQASLEQIVAREKNQWPESKKAENAHYIINNDSVHSLILQVVSLHQLLKS